MVDQQVKFIRQAIKNLVIRKGAERFWTAFEIDVVGTAPQSQVRVVGFPGTYFFDGSYYRRDGKKWEMTYSLSGAWDQIDSGAVPPGLLAEPDEHSKPGKGVGRGK